MVTHASTVSPWLTLRESAARARRSPRYMARQIRAGRLKACVLTGRGDYVLKPEWVDEFIESLMVPQPVNFGRRRA